MIGRSLILKTSALRPVEKLVRRSFLFRPVVKRFIAGDTLEEALQASEALLRRGFLISLDYLGENTASEEEALQAKATYIQMLHEIETCLARLRTEPGLLREDGKEPLNISIKLTQCGLDQGDEFAERNYREVLTAAGENFVRVDMESSAYTERTVRMIERVWQDHRNTGTVLQSYLYRTPQDLETMIRLGIRTRLVKGAYLEPPDVAYPQKAKVDEAYVSQAKTMLEEAHYPAFATHDKKIIDSIVQHASANKIEKSRFEFQMLYGIRRDLQDRLLAEGYNVRVYVPFGDSWYPYFTRRLAERPANALFILRSLFKG
jgi:proline dehydrogenase